MKKTVLIILGIGLIIYISTQLRTNRMDLSQEYDNTNFDLPPGTFLEQQIRPRYNNFYRIILTKTNNPIIDSKTMIADPMRFEIINKMSGKTIREIKFSALNIPVLEKLSFTFDPISDSAGKTYSFRITSLGKDNKNLSYVLTFGGTVSKIDRNLDLRSSNNDDIIGALAFRSYYKAPVSELTVDSIQDFINRFCQDKYFTVIYAGLILVLVIIYLII
ncbi:hypothetical protein A2154_02090 [Candidatus Gottesmanbacteria bacterium RBG_16_43_7]|uniref:Uncharacterized protein n=1 Tax=Candidatus Gottesmanbacteria bacterium RBG_16_43_7 TaxID=1798373 RepID=A0A1F5ZC61_9BACT|nr:MAG: hypothetical protein A2154_02090 [Candidatus Gottesmanbacteria bacterium RBG_16_43_7]